MRDNDEYAFQSSCIQNTERCIVSRACKELGWPLFFYMVVRAEETHRIRRCKNEW
jgi:hypothetical protein